MTAVPSSDLNLAGGLQGLRMKAQQDPKSVVREAAKQFETMFTQQLLKSMRESTMKSDLMENEGTSMGTEMLDSQWATKVSGQPGGLADMIARQLERQMHLDVAPKKTESANPIAPDVVKPDAPVALPQKAAAAFITNNTQAAQAAEKATGIPAAFMIAQAAHETGWGRKEIRNADGTASHNLFGIKAGADWKGPVTETTTTEYVKGVAHKVVQRFRAYDSYAQSFADYAKLMKESPRYAKVVNSAGDARQFAQGLQRAGYATDPAYATKLAKVINTTLRVQRGMA
jgi:flagellar protein FlgJ